MARLNPTLGRVGNLSRLSLPTIAKPIYLRNQTISQVKNPSKYIAKGYKSIKEDDTEIIEAPYEKVVANKKAGDSFSASPHRLIYKNGELIKEEHYNIGAYKGSGKKSLTREILYKDNKIIDRNYEVVGYASKLRKQTVYDTQGRILHQNQWGKWSPKQVNKVKDDKKTYYWNPITKTYSTQYIEGQKGVSLNKSDAIKTSINLNKLKYNEAVRNYVKKLKEAIDYEKIKGKKIGDVYGSKLLLSRKNNISSSNNYNPIIKKENLEALKGFGKGFVDIPLSYAKGAYKYGQLHIPESTREFIDRVLIPTSLIPSKGKLELYKRISKNIAKDQDIQTFLIGSSASLLPASYMVPISFGMTGISTYQTIKSPTPENIGRTSFLGLLSTIGLTKNIKGRFHNNIKKMKTSKQNTLKEYLKIAEKIDTKVHRNLKHTEIEVLRPYNKNQKLNIDLNNYFAQHKDIVAGGSFAQRTQMKTNILKKARLPQDGDLYINMKNLKKHSSNIINILKKHNVKGARMSKKGTPTIYADGSGDGNVYSFHDLTKIKSNIIRFNPIKGEFYKLLGIKKTPNGANVLNIKYQAKNKIFGAMYERYKLKGKVDSNILKKKIKNDYKDFYDILESSANLKNEPLLRRLAKNKKGSYYGRSEKINYPFTKDPYGLPFMYNIPQDRKGTIYPTSNEVTKFTYPNYDLPKSPDILPYPNIEVPKATSFTTGGDIPYEESFNKETTLTKDNTIPFFKEVNKKKGKKRRLKKQHKKIRAYIPFAYKDNGDTVSLGYYGTKKEAELGGMEATDYLPYNKFYIKEDEVDGSLIKKAPPYNKVYKFKKIGNTYKERRPYRFDHLNERKGNFNYMKFLNRSNHAL